MGDFSISSEDGYEEDDAPHQVRVGLFSSIYLKLCGSEHQFQASILKSKVAEQPKKDGNFSENI